MRITTQGDYALRCILNIARNSQSKKPVAISRIIEEEKLPIDYIEQLLMKMRRKRLIKSVRGARGGYLLEKDSGRISVKDVLEAVEGEAFEVICARRKQLNLKRCHDSEGCVLREVWLGLKGQIDGYLGQQTLKSLLSKIEKKG